MMRELIIDSFAGGGGASFGIELALGRSPDVAINHDAEAIALHAANHPHAKHYREDVWKVDPQEATNGQPVGLMWLSPDCFPAGTLVLTDKGYRAIETIEVGDRVLTHKCRYRKVTETSRAKRPLMTIRGHGHPGLSVSPEHPFYTRKHQRDNPEWLPASALSKEDYWATPTFFPRIEIPVVPGRPLEIDERLMWLAGRYVGDGWTRLTETRAELVITCSKHEADELRPLLNRWPRAGSRAGAGELAWHERATTTAYQFTTDHRGLVTWLREHFGHRAEHKSLPAWSLGMSPEFREALLEGYLSADGHDRQNFRELHTVSKGLACSVKNLAQSLGNVVAMYVQSNSTAIEGRQVNARPLYKLRWRHLVDVAHRQTFESGDLRWTPIREVTHTTQVATVYNIGVEGDESYVVEGIVVHNCKHFSKAKGGKPVSKRVRGLAWVAVRWAAAVRPRVIVLENVEEFTTWGPVLADTQRPCPDRKGKHFRAFKRKLERLGYVVDYRMLRACDFGAPTIRRRLFLIARCDGRPIVWPTPTHGPHQPLPWRTAAECIDWSIPCPSIFERKRPLAVNTLKRVAAGLRRYVIESPRPFIVRFRGDPDGRVVGINEPMPTVTSNSFVKRPGGAAPLGLVVPTIVNTANGQTTGRGPNAWSIEEPARTITASPGFALVAPTLAEYHSPRRAGDDRARELELPLAVQDTSNRFGLVSAFLAKHYGERRASDVNAASLFDPVPTVTSVDHNAVVASTLVALRGGDPSHHHGDSPDAPLRTISAGGTHHAEVRAFLVAYYGNEKDGASLFDPVRTVTSKERFGLVTVDGQDYAIGDIGMRMLAPRELYRAQGFPDSYRIDVAFNGKPMTKTAQVRMCGNSVCPPVAAAIVQANCSELLAAERAA